MKSSVLSIRGARTHNLKNISLDLPKDKLIVVTGLSGSGKSSLAFDTVYAEGQRRYMESLSSYARQFLELQDKPDVDSIEGLSPTVAIDQKSSSHNPRSTVGTVTEIYDFLRVLFARVAKPVDPKTGKALIKVEIADLVGRVVSAVNKGDVVLYAPMVEKKKGEFQQVFLLGKNEGYTEVRYDEVEMAIDEALSVRKLKTKEHDIAFIVNRFEKGEKVVEDVLAGRLKQALELTGNRLLLYRDDTGDEEELILGYQLSTEIQIPEPDPRLFSFNAVKGACKDCTGLGMKLVFEPELVMTNPKLSILEGAIKPWSRLGSAQSSVMKSLELAGLSTRKPVTSFTKPELKRLWHGDGEFKGVLALLEEKYRTSTSDYVRHELEAFMRNMTCPSCEGQRLRPEVLLFQIAGMSIADVTALPIADVPSAFAKMKREMKHIDLEIVERVAKEIEERVRHLIDVGLGYLTLDRSAMSLSGGEAQRMRLATQLGSSLSGMIYILDEPSIGLHPRDNRQLIDTIRSLRDLGNTVIVVEHDEEMIASADYVVDIGPGAGAFGGQIVAEGTPSELKKSKDSLTGQYLSGKKRVPIPKSVRKGSGKVIKILGATEHNLQNVDLAIPLGTFVCVTGVSGSGKSTLILDILSRALAQHFYRAKAYPGAHKAIKGLEHIDKVVAMDQSPIGRTPRSNPATYTGVFTTIRDLFTEVTEAKIRGYDAGKFSFNVKGGGRCEACSGDGQIRIEMQFMPDVFADCSECAGTRYQGEVLEVRYRGKSIADVLAMTIDEARRFFSDKSAIYEKLNVLYEVGLGYLKLGQSATTLSGGEAQRVKLATELSRRGTGSTLYILDEPTTGLHFEDIARLLQVLHALVDKGNTILVIEHNVDVMLASDWVIDMGPEGGAKGGRVVGEGAPKDLAKKKTHTGQYLKSALNARKG